MEGWKFTISICSLQCDGVLGTSSAASVGVGSFDCTHLEGTKTNCYGWRTWL